jgi:hypothetical protein
VDEPQWRVVLSLERNPNFCVAVLGVFTVKMELLIPVWGKRYISDFAAVGLMSLLSDNNIPLVSRDFDINIKFLTTNGGRDIFESLHAILALKKFCTISYLSIDDLVSSYNYGVTLTLAFARGIMSTGADQTNIAFVFMNSDFVIADGSLNTVSHLLRAGNRCIITPSLRVNAEAVTPVLVDRLKKEGATKTFDSRRMVRLALDNLHSTVLARTLTQNVVSCSQNGQFYWRVDEDTLVGAHHLIFHIAIWPEAPLTDVNSYHDYCFVPEMIPSGEFMLIDDSDDFFMLELQNRFQEREMIRFGRRFFDEMRSELSIWATKEHRAFARSPVTFHTKDATGNAVSDTRTQAVEFVSELHKQMVQPPVSHVDHFFWRAGVEAWISVKRAETARRAKGREPAFGKHAKVDDAFAMPPELNKRYEKDTSSEEYRYFLELVTPPKKEDILLAARAASDRYPRLGSLLDYLGNGALRDGVAITALIVWRLIRAIGRKLFSGRDSNASSAT